jgi:hypothetical protein
MVITRIEPLSCAKLAGTLYALVGVAIGAVVSVIALAGGFGSDSAIGAGARQAVPDGFPYLTTCRLLWMTRPCGHMNAVSTPCDAPQASASRNTPYGNSTRSVTRVAPASSAACQISMAASGE